jgi:2',3'-cyclic-nucleotide 2'-phosphodiesterase (5'-nucleotidase family)
MNTIHRPYRAFTFFCLSMAVLLGVGLGALTACTQPAPTPVNPSPLSSPLGVLKSPLTQPMATAALQPGSTFALTVLHTNDTWGYLVPCG